MLYADRGPAGASLFWGCRLATLQGLTKIRPPAAAVSGGSRPRTKNRICDIVPGSRDDAGREQPGWHRGYGTGPQQVKGG